MRTLLCAICCPLMASYSTNCFGHGNPIVVHVIENRLTVGGGLFDEGGYAQWVFADGDDEAIFLPAPGNILLLDLPGLDVNGMAAGDGLWLEVVALPDYSTETPTDHSLWYWSASLQEVAPLPSDHELEILSARVLGSSILVGESEHTPSEMLVAELKPSDIGQHRHLLNFALPNSPPAPEGSYGFFAQLASPGYETSEPFLIALNHGLDAASFQAGALAINLAALPPEESLPGDFDSDGIVDGHDFLLWQREGQSLDLTHWEQNFGTIASGDSIVARVPEPSSLVLLMLAALGIANRSPAGRG